jgi:predicted RND superfamily exporter protein
MLGDVSMGEIRRLSRDVDEWADARGIGDQIVITGEGIPTAYLSSESIREMGVGIAISVLLSAILVGLYFRSAKASVSILAATCVPILAGFGVWGWFESEIGMAATLVIATTIGVVIDDTIHLTYRYVDSLRHLDLTPWGATAYSVHKTGTAIFVTSVVLVAGLLVLVLSDFRMNSTFGVCSSLIIALALVYNLTVAPRLLNHLR